MTPILDWQPEPTLLEKIIALAEREGKPPEAIINEAITLYLDAQLLKPTDSDCDPLIGLFSGTPNLATQSEDILENSINDKSGWTWKQPLP